MIRANANVNTGLAATGNRRVSVRSNAPAEVARRRFVAGLLSAGFATVARPDVALAKSRKEKQPPPKSEYELMMDRLKEEGRGSQEARVQQEFEKIKPACTEYGGEVRSNYASGMGRYYDCQPSDEAK